MTGEAKIADEFAFAVLLEVHKNSRSPALSRSTYSGVQVHGPTEVYPFRIQASKTLQTTSTFALAPRIQPHLNFPNPSIETITANMAENAGGIDRKADERMEFSTSKEVTVHPTFESMSLKG